MLDIQENISLKERSTFKMGGIARYFAVGKDEKDLEEAHYFAKEKGLKLFLLGKGSNCVFADIIPEMLVVSVEIKGISSEEKDETETFVTIGAGEEWDEVVAWSVLQGLSGIESMSAIPGTAGATPVQNVGAYGQEIKDTLVELRAFDRKEEKFVVLSNEECHFAYRTSIFNTTEKERYLISSITLKLSSLPPRLPEYPGVRDYFEMAKNKLGWEISVQEIRDAIIEIRANKLPDPSVVASVGSFFKNVLIEKEQAIKLQKEYPGIPTFIQPDGKIKVPSGWLLEKAGFKGKSFGNISVYEKNALVLVHNGKGNFTELQKAKDEIIAEIEKRFGVTLVPEPLFVA